MDRGFVKIWMGLLLGAAVIGAGLFVWQKIYVLDGHVVVNPTVVDEGNGRKSITTIEDINSYYGQDPQATGKFGHIECSRFIKGKVTREIYNNGTPVPPIPGQLSDIKPLDPLEAKKNCTLTSTAIPIENDGKITVLQKPEVQALLSHYRYVDVQLKALKFSYIQDKGFMERLLPLYKGRDIGCIIVLTTPGESRVYIEDEKLQTFEELDFKTFSDYLNKASPADRQLFLENLH
jgi:hypothetical protein